MFEHIFSRHADADREKLKKGQESGKYPGITEKGEEKSLSSEKITELAVMVENAPDRAVIILGGFGKAVRTRSTLEAYTDRLKEYFKGKEDIVFAPAGKEALGFVNNPENSGKKIIISQPIQLKHFSGDMDKFEEWEKYAAENKIPEEKEVETWLGSKEAPGPDPKEMAEGMLLDMERADTLVAKLFPDRPFVSVNVSHSFILDALAAYLANGGEINEEAFRKTGGRVIENNELMKITQTPGGETILEYRGNQFTFDPKDEEAEL